MEQGPERLTPPKSDVSVRVSFPCCSRLSSGKLQDLGVVEGSKLTLVPTVEAGLMSQASRPEQSVMQALESLTETQVRSRNVRALTPKPRCPVTLPTLPPSRRGCSGHTGPARKRLTAASSRLAQRWTVAPGATTPPAAAQSRKPGAVIESFVNHAPGVFSGTFSGTLHPNCQDSSGRPRPPPLLRTNSNSSVSSEGSLDLDFEDSVWKPEVKADLKSEFVIA
nr:midnolin [Pelodiscus sinensis]|eukprot:XP_014430017.1 midnolin [Pelodiscus sinensis]